MDSHADAYVDFVKECALSYPTKPYAVVEKRLDYSHVAPEGFGTCDCLLIGGGLLTIIDYKYGKGVAVSAENNPQLMLYGLGGINTYGLLYPINEVKMAIMQPRLDSTSVFTLPAATLNGWANVVRPIAQIAYDGNGQLKAGEHCRFCKIGGECKARAEANLTFSKVSTVEPHLLSPDDIAFILTQASQFKEWIASIEKAALKTVLLGGNIPGWKAVAGRGSRQFTDPDKAFSILKGSGIDESLLYNRVPLSLAEIEKTISKKTFKELLSELVVKSEGAPTLAPLSDKRKVFQGSISAEEAFKDIN